VAECVALAFQTAKQFKWRQAFIFNTLPAIVYTKCRAFIFLF